MDRRRFIQGLSATGVGLGVGLGPLALSGVRAAGATSSALPTPPPPRIALGTLSLDKLATLGAFPGDGGAPWHVQEDLSHPDGNLVLHDGTVACVLGKRTEATHAADGPAYLGMALKDIALADADLLADCLLRQGEPDETEVRDAAPPAASSLKPEDYYGRLPWTTFVGHRHCADTMPVYTSGSTRTYRVDQVFADLHDPKRVARRREGLLGGWLPAVHKVVPIDDGRWYDILVFAEVDARERFVVRTWHRTMRVEHGKASHVIYGESYPACPPRRVAPDAAAFYAALLRFHDRWHTELADVSPATLPAQDWTDLARFAFAREIVVRPDGTYPRYGAVDRDYAGNEYDGFQDTFTSSLYANLEWGRFTQAAAVFDGYFTDFVRDDGTVEMRGAEMGQYGLTLSLVARYLQYTGDAALLRKHATKIQAIVGILFELHDASLALPSPAPGHGLIHGWNESDACLFPEPMLWWKPYYANTALTVRGLLDLEAVWTGVSGAQATKGWRKRADDMRRQLERTLRANVRRDLTPPYVGPMPGVTLTFTESLHKETPSEQQWPHRAYAELLQADVLPDDLAHLVIDAMRGHGATSIGVVANIGPRTDQGRDLLGFISYGYARQLLQLGRIDEYVLFLYAHRYHVHTPGSWTAGEVTDISGGMPLFCMPAQMTVPLLLRWALVFDGADDDTLYLCRGVPRAWIATRKPIGIEQAPTRWGRVGVTLRHTDDDRIEGAVTLPSGTVPTVWLHLGAEKGRRIEDVTVDGVAVPANELKGDSIRVHGKPAQVLSIRARIVG